MEDKNLNKNQEDVETNKEEVNDDIQVDATEIESKLQEKEEECNKYLDMLKRTTAEYENFRKRTQKEKESMFGDGFRSAVEKLLPVIDNLERALEHSDEEGPLKEGLNMTLKMFKDILEKEGVTEIPSLGEKFDPNVHNAVMHVEDEAFGENEVIEVFLKGYQHNDKVIRHSMVKVAN